MKRIIPEKVQIETTVQVVLPPEASAILRDLHRDRENIGSAGAILLACLVALTLKRLFGRAGN